MTDGGISYWPSVVPGGDFVVRRVSGDDRPGPSCFEIWALLISLAALDWLGFLAGAWLMLRLIVKDVNVQRWKEQASAIGMCR